MELQKKTDTLNIEEPKNINYTAQMSCEALIRFHIIFYLYIKGITLSKGELNALTLLGIRGKQPMLAFCTELASRKIFANIQSARNALGRLETDEEGVNRGLIEKSGKHKKMVWLSDAMQVSNKKNTFLYIKCYYQ